MTVRELIEALQKMPPDAPVLIFPYDGANPVHAAEVRMLDDGDVLIDDCVTDSRLNSFT